MNQISGINGYYSSSLIPVDWTESIGISCRIRGILCVSTITTHLQLSFSLRARPLSLPNLLSHPSLLLHDREQPDNDLVNGNHSNCQMPSLPINTNQTGLPALALSSISPTTSVFALGSFLLYRTHIVNVFIDDIGSSSCFRSIPYPDLSYRSISTEKFIEVLEPIYKHIVNDNLAFALNSSSNGNGGLTSPFVLKLRFLTKSALRARWNVT